MRRPAWPGYSDDPATRRRQIRAQIRGKAKHVKENLGYIEGLRYAILFGRRNAHRRLPNEYEQPEQVLRIATWEVARSIDLHDRRSFDERPLTWMGVRGAKYRDPARWFHPPNEWVETWGELVPEPFNKFDDHALAIDLDGIRIGYAPRGYAEYAHPYIAALNNHGFRILTPLHYQCAHDPTVDLLIANAYAALPTFGELDKLLPTDEEYTQILTPMWDALGPEVRADILRGQPVLDENTIFPVLAQRHLALEAGLPRAPRLTAIPPGVDRFFSRKKVEQQQAEIERRRRRDESIVAAFEEGWTQVRIAETHDVSTSTVAKALRNAGVDTRTPRVNPTQRRERSQIIAMLEGGISRREIIETLGVSNHTIAAAAKEAGIAVPSQTGVNDYSRAKMRERLEICRHALRLQAEGSSRAEIAQQLGVSKDTVKIHLADGRFFENPRGNPDRLDRARALREVGATKSQLVSSADRRALRDANMLDLIGKPWL